MPQQIVEIEAAYSDLENMLAGRCWFCGSWVTLSDIVFASTISTLNLLVPIDKQKLVIFGICIYSVLTSLVAMYEYINNNCSQISASLKLATKSFR